MEWIYCPPSWDSSLETYATDLACLQIWDIACANELEIAYECLFVYFKGARAELYS